MTTDISKTSGDWNSASTWSDGVPVAISTVKIAALDTVNLYHGSAIVGDLTVADGATLDVAGASLTTNSDLTDDGDIIGSGEIIGSLDGAGTVSASGGVFDLQGPVDSDDEGIALHIGSGATLQLDSSVGAAGSLFSGASATHVSFATNGVLDLTGEGSGSSGEISDFQATVSNFGAGDSIKVAGTGPTDQVRFNPKTDILSVTTAKGVLLDQVYLTGDYSNANFSLSSEVVEDTITVNAICFMAGTQIRTPDGEVAVETLKRGDPVVTTEGLAKPVAWLGRQTISTRFANPLRTWPVRVKVGALGDNVPSRDLILSPDHALLVEGVLIQAGALVNGTSILREFVVPSSFVYYHIELDDHSLILAENTPAESFIDNAERLAFDNWDEHEALYPEGKPLAEMPYARAKGPRQVPMRIRIALAERAHRLGLLTVDVA